MSADGPPQGAAPPPGGERRGAPFGGGHMNLAQSLADAGLDWIVPQWNGPANVRAFFTTRNDAGDVRAFVPSGPVRLVQVHGCDVARVDPRDAAALRAAPPRADAAVTQGQDVVLTVRTADCLPMLFADRGGTTVAVAHAGWRGLAAGVLEATIAAMPVRARDVVGWIGPAIGPRAFEVGRDVFDAYCVADPGASSHFAPLREGKWLADLPALARRRLAAVGVVDVDGGLWCTHTQADRFHSYRRDRAGGRMALVAWLASRQ